MKTITFYSYKGGVGRSLAVSKIAIRLSELRLKVCVIDFDLDAPGLRFKFKHYTPAKEIKTGIVDYIHKFSDDGVIPNKISDYAISLVPSSDFFEPITFISAGDINDNNYWKKLSAIKWYDLFYSDQARGVELFLDLKAKILSEFDPDFLLIDSRTGITDISGVTLRLFADHVVVLGINNDENLFGSKKILKSLLNPNNSLFEKAPEVNFVLTRLPFGKKDKEKEFVTVEKVRNDFKSYLGIDDFDISVIHADPNIEQEEARLHLSNYEDQPGSIIKDYLELFEKITKGTLNMDEGYLASRQAEIEYVKSFDVKDLKDKLLLLNKAVGLDSTKFAYHLQRGVVNYMLDNIDESINDHLQALTLNPNDAHINYNLGIIYSSQKKYDEALNYFRKAESYGSDTYHAIGIIYGRLNKNEEAISAYTKALNITPTADKVLNSRADLLRKIGRYEDALKDVTMAIELTPNESLYFGTLAEIYSSQGKEEEFFLNLSIALSMGLQPRQMSSAYDVYKKYFNNDRFLNLISKYKISINDITPDKD